MRGAPYSRTDDEKAPAGIPVGAFSSYGEVRGDQPWSAFSSAVQQVSTISRVTT